MSFADKFGGGKKPGFADKVEKKDILAEEAEDAEENEGGKSFADMASKKNRDGSFKDIVNKSRGGDVCLILATDKTMRKAWYFVLPEPTKRERLLGLGAKDSCNLEDFGQIVLSGYGERPPQWAYDRIKEEYGTEFD
jgi:hypothetical protein